MFDTFVDSSNMESGQKRRRQVSVSIAPLTSPSDPEDGPAASESNHEIYPDVMSTPRKAKKKVRFSDPGPEICNSSSTGLTPSINRCSMGSGLLSVAPRRKTGTLTRRSSMPVMSSAVSPSTSEIVQFQPLKQILGERTRRSIRRLGISEEQNNIEREKRANLRRRKSELDLLRLTIEKKDEEIRKLKHAHDSARLSTKQEADRIKQLEAEVYTLRQDINRPHEPSTPMTNQDDEDVLGLNIIDESFLSGEFDANMTGIQTHNSSYLETPPETPRAPRYMTPAAVSTGTQSNIPDPEKCSLARKCQVAEEEVAPHVRIPGGDCTVSPPTPDEAEALSC